MIWLSVPFYAALSRVIVAAMMDWCFMQPLCKLVLDNFLLVAPLVNSWQICWWLLWMPLAAAFHHSPRWFCLAEKRFGPTFVLKLLLRCHLGWCETVLLSFPCFVNRLNRKLRESCLDTTSGENLTVDGLFSTFIFIKVLVAKLIDGIRFIKNHWQFDTCVPTLILPVAS